MPSLPIPPISLNAVIVATNFNPSVFSQYWFLKNDLFKPEDFVSPETQAFTPLAVQFQTPNLEFLVISDRVQVNLKIENEDYQNLVSQTLGKVADILPHTPFRAIGFNMNWRVGKLSNEAFGVIDRKVFFKYDNNIFDSYFTEPDCRFGSYLSKDFRGGRLRLTITPIRVAGNKETNPHEGLDLNFNFNFNLVEEKRVIQIHENINSWNASYEFAQKIATELNVGLQ